MAHVTVGLLAPEDDKGGAMSEDSDGKMAEEGEDEGDEKEGNEAAQRTALVDFLSAIGVKPKGLDKALSAFKDLAKACDYDEEE